MLRSVYDRDCIIFDSGSEKWLSIGYFHDEMLQILPRLLDFVFVTSSVLLAGFAAKCHIQVWCIFFFFLSTNLLCREIPNNECVPLTMLASLPEFPTRHPFFTAVSRFPPGKTILPYFPRFLTDFHTFLPFHYRNLSSSSSASERRREKRSVRRVRNTQANFRCPRNDNSLSYGKFKQRVRTA